MTLQVWGLLLAAGEEKEVCDELLVSSMLIYLYIYFAVNYWL
jgi:hypothetical protein